MSFFRTLCAAAATLALAACADRSVSTITAAPEGPQASQLVTGVVSAATAAPMPVKSALPSGRCIDGLGSTQMSVRQCTGASYQLISWSDAGEMKSGNSCLTAWGGQGRDGDRLTMYGCTNTTDQKWRVTAAGEIRGINDKCLDIRGAIGNEGDAVIINACTGGTSQKWLVTGAPDTPATTPTPPTTPTTPSTPAADTTPRTTPAADTTGSKISVGSGKLLPMMPTMSPSLCWDFGSSTQISLRKCEDAAFQKFNFLATGEIRAGNGCLVAWGGQGRDGDRLTAYGCSGPESKWTVTSAGEIRGINGKCIEVVGGKGQVGDAIAIATCTGAASQKWTNVVGSPTPSTPATPTPQPPVVATVTLSTSALSLTVPATAQLTATAKDASGTVIDGRTVTWASTSASATVSTTGLVTAVAAGGATITATIDGKSASATVNVQAAPAPAAPSTPGGYFVSPTGSASGDGSIGRPWNLATALAHPAVVRAGDTLWLRGGTYRGEFTSTLRGQAGRPVVVRQYPGERAIVDGGLAIRGPYSWFWGFEVMNSDLGALVTAVDVYGAGTKVINMIIHDAAGNGIGLWNGADDAEVYGNVLYNIGRAGSSAGRYAHGIYFQNVIAGKRLVDNIVANSYSYNFHGYTENAGLNNLYLEGNISFNAGSFVTYGGAEFLVGGGQPIRNLVFTGNYSYRGGSKGANARNEIGYGAPTPAGNVVSNNYLTGGTKLRYLDGLTFTGNTLLNAGREMLEIFQNADQSIGSGFVFSNNTYRAPNARDIAAFRRVTTTGTGYSFAEWQALGMDRNSDFQIASATGLKVVVRRNIYESGRANVAVYNWDNLGSVSVDLTGVLAPGDRYEVREVQDYFGQVVTSGVYGGGSVSVSMSPVTAVRPLGAITTPAPSTGTEFHTFVVRKL